MKTKCILIGLITIGLFLINASAIAQNKTEYSAYQNTVHELAEKYYCIVHYHTDNPKNITFEEKMAMELFIGDVYDADKYEVAISLLLLAAANTMTLSEVNALKTMMLADLESAKKLRNNADIQRDNELAQKKAEQERKRAEQERANAERQKRLETDRGRIEDLVERKFNKWCVKGNYEKTTDYENRLKNKSDKIFDSICYVAANSILSDKEYTIKHGKYDADKETLPIAFMIYTKDKRNDIVKSNFTLKIPISDAKDTDFGKIRTEALEIAFYNNCIIYKKLIFKYYRKQDANEIAIDMARGQESKLMKTCGPFDVSLENTEDIIISANNLTLNSPYLKHHSYNYTEEKKINSTFNKYKKYFENKNEFLSYFKKGEEVFYEELKIRQLYEEYNPTLSIATKSDFSVIYNKCNKDEKTLKETIEYYQKMKDKYLQKSFLGNEKKFYSLYFELYIKKGNKKGFESEVYRLYYYNTNKDLYTSEEEFNNIYKSCPKCAKNDIDARKYIRRYKYDIRKLSQDDYKILVTNSIYNYDKGITSTMDKVIEGNSSMYKEFNKNGSYFSNTKEFFNSYIGENYKTDLKNKQKQRK